MANLLPNDIQERIFRRAMLRVTIAVTVFLAFAAGLCLLAFAPAYLTLKTEQSSLAYDLASLDGGTLGGNDTAADVADAARQLRILDTLMRAPSVTSAFDSVLAAKPEDLSVQALLYAPGSGTSTQPVITLSGTGASADEQTQYLAALRAVPAFSSVDIPISALARTDSDALTVVIHGSF